MNEWEVGVATAGLWLVGLSCAIQKFAGQRSVRQLFSAGGRRTRGVAGKGATFALLPALAHPYDWLSRVSFKKPVKCPHALIKEASSAAQAEVPATPLWLEQCKRGVRLAPESAATRRHSFARSQPIDTQLSQSVASEWLGVCQVSGYAFSEGRAFGCDEFVIGSMAIGDREVVDSAFLSPNFVTSPFTGFPVVDPMDAYALDPGWNSGLIP